MESDDFVSKCADCVWCRVPPENAGSPVFAYCSLFYDWVDPYEVSPYNYDCFAGNNEEMK